MDYRLFSLFTLLGATLWCSVLCYVGIKAGQDDQLMKGEYHRLTLWLAGATIVASFVGILLVISAAHAEAPDGTDPNSPMAAWFRSVRAPAGGMPSGSTEAPHRFGEG